MWRWSLAKRFWQRSGTQGSGPQTTTVQLRPAPNRGWHLTEVSTVKRGLSTGERAETRK